MWAWTCRTCCHRWFGSSTTGCPRCAAGPSPMGRGFPVGSVGFSANTPWLWPVSEDLPSGPHGQWLARGSSSSPSLLCSLVPWVPAVSGSSWLLPQSGGVSSIRLASLCCSTFSPKLVGLVPSSGASFGCVVAAFLLSLSVPLSLSLLAHLHRGHVVEYEYLGVWFVSSFSTALDRTEEPAVKLKVSNYIIEDLNERPNLRDYATLPCSLRGRHDHGGLSSDQQKKR